MELEVLVCSLIDYFHYSGFREILYIPHSVFSSSRIMYIYVQHTIGKKKGKQGNIPLVYDGRLPLILYFLHVIKIAHKYFPFF